MLLDENALTKLQTIAIDKIISDKKIALGLAPGFGKTITTLTAFCRLKQLNKVKKMLLVAPLAVATNVWDKEAAKWLHTRHLKIVKVLDSPQKRLKALASDADIYIINNEQVPWLISHLIQFDMLVVDESHEFRGPTTKKFKALKKIETEYVVLLTGTPMPNGPENLWSQQFLLDKGEALGKTITFFRNTYFYQFSFFRFKCHSEDKIIEKIKHKWLFFVDENKEDDCGIEYKDIRVHLDLYTHKQYICFERYFIIKLNDEHITATNRAVLMNKLLQYCNGALYTKNQQFEIIHNEKLDALEYIINQHDANQNFLIAYSFQSDLVRIQERFKDAVVLTSKNVENVIKRWNNKEIKLLLCQAQKGKGLNLQFGSNIIIWFGVTI